METAQAIERFLRSPGLGESTRRAYRGDVEEFGRWLSRGGLGLRDVDVRVLTEYATELGKARPRKLAPATIARKLAAVRSFLRFTLGPANVPDAALGPRRPRRPLARVTVGAGPADRSRRRSERSVGVRSRAPPLRPAAGG